MIAKQIVISESEILNKYSNFKPLASEILKIIEEETESKLSIDELAYLMMHVSRLN